MSQRGYVCSAVIATFLGGLIIDQVRAQDQPENKQPFKESGVIELAPINLAAVRAEDETRELDGFPPRYAIPHSFQITPETHGLWQTMDDGRLVWRLTIVARGAASINLGFTRYRMPVGGQLVIGASDNSEVIRPFTSRDNAPAGETPPTLEDLDAVLL
ncbi:MAG: hypothetical protein ACE5EC_01500, partial [Phycisphaerae bacterium]